MTDLQIAVYLAKLTALQIEHNLVQIIFGNTVSQLMQMDRPDMIEPLYHNLNTERLAPVRRMLNWKWN